MPSLVKNMGKTSAPGFYSSAKTSVKSSASGVKSKLPLFALLILAGVAIIFVLRNKSSSSTQTGAALTLNPSNESDVSSIENMVQALNALNGQVHTPSPIPSGGTSTPITSNPTASIPGGESATPIESNLPAGMTKPNTNVIDSLHNVYNAEFQIPTNLVGKTSPAEYNQLVNLFARGGRTGPDYTYKPDWAGGQKTAEQFISGGQNVGGSNQPVAYDKNGAPIWA